MRRQISIAEQITAAKMRTPADVAAPKRIERSVKARAALAAELKATEIYLDQQRIARAVADHDPRTRRLEELRAAGFSRERAFAQIEEEFPNVDTPGPEDY